MHSSVGDVPYLNFLAQDAHHYRCGFACELSTAGSTPPAEIPTTCPKWSWSKF